MVQKFTGKVLKYDPEQGGGAPSGTKWIKSTWTKAKWATYFSDELSKMWLELDRAIQNLQLINGLIAM